MSTWPQRKSQRLVEICRVHSLVHTILMEELMLPSCDWVEEGVTCVFVEVGNSEVGGMSLELYFCVEKSEMNVGAGGLVFGWGCGGAIVVVGMPSFEVVVVLDCGSMVSLIYSKMGKIVGLGLQMESSSCTEENGYESSWKITSWLVMTCVCQDHRHNKPFVEWNIQEKYICMFLVRIWRVVAD